MTDYYTLVAALPHLPVPEQAESLPISRLGLERRLTMLEPEDADQLQRLESLYFYEQTALQPLSDGQRIAQWQQHVQQLHSEALRQRVMYQWELRTLLAALRYRQTEAYPVDQFAAVGRWQGFIRQHWHDPLFAMERFYPKVEQLAKRLNADQPGQAESLVQQWLWQDLDQLEKQQGFSFIALACYVLRWGLLARYLQADSRAALTRFDQLLADTLQHSELTRVLNQEVGK